MKGRKRKSGERFKSGDLKPAIDRGTLEFQSRRAWAAGGGDSTLTWHVLGVLRANDQISEDEYRVGCSYRNLFGLVYRRPDLIAAPLDGVPRGGPSETDEEGLERCKARFQALEAILWRIVKAEGRRAKDVWDNIVVYDRTPNWMRPVVPRISDVREAELFLHVIKTMTESRMGERRPIALKVVA